MSVAEKTTVANAASNSDPLAPRAPVTVVGMLPPPTNGMTVITKIVLDALAANGPIRIYNLANSRPYQRYTTVRFVKAIRFLGALVWLLMAKRFRGGILYLAANSNSGLYQDLILVALAPYLGYRIALHHHVYSYIDREDWRMRWIDKRMGQRDMHIVYCDQMARDFQRKYPSTSQFLTLPACIASQVKSDHSRRLGKTFRIGHISNLTIEKGLDLVIETFAALVRDEQDVRLEIAGPVMGPGEQRLLNDAMRRYPSRVRYAGAVYGSQKQAWFDAIDCLLFPTKYKNESWGIVNSEALALGIPVIAFARGCIPTVVGPGCGLVVECDTDFVSAATQQIGEWIGNPTLYYRTSELAMKYSRELSDEAERRLATLTNILHSPSP